MAGRKGAPGSRGSGSIASARTHPLRDGRGGRVVIVRGLVPAAFLADLVHLVLVVRLGARDRLRRGIRLLRGRRSLVGSAGFPALGAAPSVRLRVGLLLVRLPEELLVLLRGLVVRFRCPLALRSRGALRHQTTTGARTRFPRAVDSRTSAPARGSAGRDATGGGPFRARGRIRTRARERRPRGVS